MLYLLPLAFLVSFSLDISGQLAQLALDLALERPGSRKMEVGITNKFFSNLPIPLANQDLAVGGRLHWLACAYADVQGTLT